MTIFSTPTRADRRYIFPVCVLVFAVLTTLGYAQVPAPTPKKNPFEGFHSSLDDRPGHPSTNSNSFASTPSATPASAKSDGLKLDPRWDSPLGLSRGGPSGQKAELQALLTGFASASKETGTFPDKQIFNPVKYLTSLAAAESALGVTGKLGSGGKTAVVGFPDGLKFVEFTPDSARSYTVRILKDAVDQVVAVEFTALSPEALPPLPKPLPKPRLLNGYVYDFVPEGVSVSSNLYLHASWDLGDRVLICTRGIPGRPAPPKVADLYVPKPMANLIVYILSLP